MKAARPSHGRKQPVAERAYSLVELLLVLAIVGVLATMAIGFSAHFRRQQAFNEIAREAFHSLSMARGEAIQRGTRAKVQFVGRRMYVFVEELPGNDRYDSSDDRVYQWPPRKKKPYDSQVELTSPNLPFESGITVIFDHRGFTINSDGTYVGPVLCFRDLKSDSLQAVEATVAGAVRVVKNRVSRLCPDA